MHKTKFFSSVLWMTSLRFATKVLAYIKLAVLARIFTPQIFGVVGIASLILAFLEILTETGINTVLIQEKNVKKYINSAWIVSIIRGFFISILIVVFAPSIGTFFHSQDTILLLYLISIVPLVRGFINPAEIIFLQKLNFNKEFYFRFPIFLVETVVCVLFAIATKNPNSFIYGFIISAMFEVFISFAFVDIKPNFKFDFDSVKFILQRGKWLTGNGILQYLFRQGDDIAVGKLLGSTPLGFYQQAYKISSVPLTEIADIVAKTTFPIYSSLNLSVSKLRKIFLFSQGIVFVVCGTLGLFIYIFAESITSLILGNNWLEIVPLVRILVTFGVFRSVTFTNNSLLLALKKQNLVVIVSFIETVSLGILIYPFLTNFGLNGVGYACVIATIIGVLISSAITIQYIWKKDQRV